MSAQGPACRGRRRGAGLVPPSRTARLAQSAALPRCNVRRRSRCRARLRRGGDWYRRAAEQGLVEAQRHLAEMYLAGEGVPQNPSEAVAWYSKAAAQDDAVAEFYLGAMHASGQGVAQDNGEAANWYLRSAEHGLTEARYLVGLMYARGEGVPQDYVQAHKWLNLAAAHGDKEARTQRDQIARQMTLEQIAEAQRLASAEAATKVTRVCLGRRPRCKPRRPRHRSPSAWSRPASRSWVHDPGPADGSVGPGRARPSAPFRLTPGCRSRAKCRTNNIWRRPLSRQVRGRGGLLSLGAPLIRDRSEPPPRARNSYDGVGLAVGPRSSVFSQPVVSGSRQQYRMA